eukprot:CAMPEP_0119046602 /NCGR_PEP_ID=MMETSP1177-20130426/47729_1 /TAXON_ID=2985 /ORGANISM="Ochromonas sp, Strain CCMP1899" /LENGTH=112 /DNA_ID=CAMNT_0007019985 /DNA_START=28 /DNA_END=362 /DNA_ORIENTATION=+
MSQQLRKSNNRSNKMTELKTSNGLKVPKISRLQIVEKRIPSNEQRNDGDLTDLSISSSEMLSEIPVNSAMRPSSLGTVTLPTAMEMGLQFGRALSASSESSSESSDDYYKHG